MTLMPMDTARDYGQNRDGQHRDSQYRDSQYHDSQNRESQYHDSQYHDDQYHDGQDGFSVDIEKKALNKAHLQNTTVHNFTWAGVTVIVNDRKTKKPKVILRNVYGMANAGM